MPRLVEELEKCLEPDKDCFARTEEGRCTLLKEYIPNCPFKKSVQQFKKEKLIYDSHKREE
jgi:hypothetical protein